MELVIIFYYVMVIDIKTNIINIKKIITIYN